MYNLRGRIRGNSGDAAKREGQNVFDIMTGVAITVLVKNPKQKSEKATIYYHDIGDYLSRAEKLEILTKSRDVTNNKIGWTNLKPNEHGDWLNQRSDLFGSFITIGDKQDASKGIFNIYSGGLLTSRNAWCYNFSKSDLVENVKKTIHFYNEQREIYKTNRAKKAIEDVLDVDQTKISWSRALKNNIKRDLAIEYTDDAVRIATFRPFEKIHVYFHRDINEMVYQLPKIFPTNDKDNVIISVAGGGGVKPFSAFISNTIKDYDTDGGVQCFPLYYYEKLDGNVGTLFDTGTVQYAKRDGITDFILDQCHKAYGNKVTKEDIFYYVYGLLHSRDYLTQFAADLKKMLPRIPLVEKPADFWSFSKAGRELADLHLNYEDVDPCPGVVVTGADSGNFRVEKMKFITKGDKTAVQYNPYIKITNIPLRAYDYVVNGKSAIEWVMERYAVTVDKASQIKNDPNDWAEEHNHPRYILDLLLSVINVSLKTLDIVENLPKLEFK